MEVKVEVFTLCWNEMAILPFVVDYWERYATHVTVYDNGSTDGSVEYLAKIKNLVSVKPFDTGGEKDNTAIIELKNQMWKEARGRADWVVVCDMDEMLIPTAGSLENITQSGATICMPLWYDLMSDEVPQYEYRYLHVTRPFAKYNPASKAVLFNPNAIDEINYTPGAHHCNPTGNVKWGGNAIYLLHANNALSLEYRLQRYHQQAARLSASDKEKGHGIHYSFTDESIINNWHNDLSKRIDFGAILNW